jgi:hypothetical protein
VCARLTDGTRDSSHSHVFSALLIVLGTFIFTKSTLISVHYRYSIPSCRCWKNEILRTCDSSIFTLQVGASWIESFHGNGLAEAILSPGHLFPPHFHHLIYFSECTFTFHDCPPLCWNLLGGYQLLRLQLHTLCL